MIASGRPNHDCNLWRRQNEKLLHKYPWKLNQSSHEITFAAGLCGADRVLIKAQVVSGSVPHFISTVNYLVRHPLPFPRQIRTKLFAFARRRDIHWRAEPGGWFICDKMQRRSNFLCIFLLSSKVYSTISLAKYVPGNNFITRSHALAKC